jgi:L,D-transpeptidase ErfK/SrfK
MKALRATALLSFLVLGLSTTTQASSYYGGNLCAYEEFDCLSVKRSDTWVKLFPNERERELVKRLNRINLPVTNRSWIVVPTNFKNISYFDLSPFPQQLESPLNREQVIVDLSDQAFAAYDSSGKLVYWGPVSGGKTYCPDTESYCGTTKGTFSVTRKQGPECVSSKFPLETRGGAPMPYCMHFFKGFAMHGAVLPGKHASHGCVRLFQSDAKWLNTSFTKVGTPVTVRD